MLLVRSVKKINFVIILGQVRLSKGKLCPPGLGMGLGEVPEVLEPLKLFSIIQDPALNQEVHLSRFLKKS